MAPSEPLRLTILKRFETILAAITAGDDFFYTPHLISKHPISRELSTWGPLFAVLTGDRTGPIDYTVGHVTRDETFYVDVRVVVHDDTDLTTKLERALTDIRKAIDEDAISSEVGSLGQLTVQTLMDESALVEYHSEGEDSFVTFNQPWRVDITGTY